MRTIPPPVPVVLPAVSPELAAAHERAARLAAGVQLATVAETARLTAGRIGLLPPRGTLVQLAQDAPATVGASRVVAPSYAIVGARPAAPLVEPASAADLDPRKLAQLARASR
jgi:hypothetical protein